MRTLSLLIAMAALTVTAASQRLPLQMEVRPLFGTTIPPYGCSPLKIILQNEGPSLEGTLVVEPSRWQAKRLHIFSVSLPTGSRKEILALPFILSNTMSVAVRLEGIRPPIEHPPLSVTPDENIRLAVAVGDEIGGLEWLNKLNPQLSKQPQPSWRPSGPIQIQWAWAYCRPEDFPDKTAALTGVSVLVLGSGAERLTMAQWQAIRKWIMMGGVLLAPGGSAAIYLRHVALASILPVRNLRTERWNDWQALGRWLNVAAPSEPAFITVGVPTSDARTFAVTDRHSLIAIRPYGYGAVVFTAFNLWDKPFRGWNGLPAFWLKTVTPHTLQTVASRWASLLTTLGQWEGFQQRWGWGPAPVPPAFFPQPHQPPSLPFRLELPSGLTVTLTLLIYFAVAVPFSYFLLKRRRALDWHWLIAPAAALIFVFVVARSAFGLYQLGNQNIARGIVMLTAGERDAYLLASATLFLQRGGVYTLDFGEAEAAFAQVREEFGPSGTELETVEGRSLTALLQVPNLGFRLLYFAKPFAFNGTVAMTAKQKGNQLSITVTNRTPFPLKTVECRPALPVITTIRGTFGWHSGAVESPVWSGPAMPLIRWSELASGETKTATLSLLSAPQIPERWPTPSRPAVSLAPRWLVLTAQVDGLDITPHINSPAQRKSFVTLQVVCPITK